MSTESEEVYYTPQSSFSEEPENVIPTNIAQESQYYTPSKRLISFGFQIDLFFTLFCMQEWSFWWTEIHIYTRCHEKLLSTQILSYSVIYICCYQH